MKRIPLAILFFVSLLAAPLVARAGVEGRLSGIVVDAEGKPLADVSVMVVGREFDFEKEATSNRKGKFSMVILDATRSYEIRLEKEGFQPLVEPIKFEVGGTLRKEWTLLAAGAAPPSAEELARIEAHNKTARLYNEGAKLYDEGRLEEAIVKMDEALAETPDLALAHAAKARFHLELAAAAKDGEGATGHYEAALDSGRELAKLVPEEPFGLRAVFDGLWGLGRYEEAEAALEDLGAIDPPGAALRAFNVGVKAVKDNELDNAKSMFARAAELHPKLPEAYLNLGLIAEAEGDSAAALGYATKVLELAPSNSRALAMQYDAYVAMGDKEKADAAFAQLKETDPEQVAETFLKDGTELWNQGQTGPACASFQRVLEIDPQHPRAHYQLGLCYASSGDVEKARTYFQRFIDLAPDDPEAAVARDMLAALG